MNQLSIECIHPTLNFLVKLSNVECSDEKLIRIGEFLPQSDKNEAQRKYHRWNVDRRIFRLV